MGTVIGELLPLAVGVAVSPIPVIAAILMLLAPRAGATGSGFLVGWLAGIVVATVVFMLIAGVAALGSSSQPSAAGGWVKIVLGVLLVLLAVRQWRGRPAEGEQAALPKWMAAIDELTAARATGLGFLLSAVNPKNLILCAAAGVAIAAGALPAGQRVVAVAVFAVFAGSTVLVPVVGYAVAAGRMRAPLGRLRGWLEVNNAGVMSVLLLVLGAVLVGKGLGGLF